MKWLILNYFTSLVYLHQPRVKIIELFIATFGLSDRCSIGMLFFWSNLMCQLLNSCFETSLLAVFYLLAIFLWSSFIRLQILCSLSYYKWWFQHMPQREDMKKVIYDLHEEIYLEFEINKFTVIFLQIGNSLRWILLTGLLESSMSVCFLVWLVQLNSSSEPSHVSHHKSVLLPF